MSAAPLKLAAGWGFGHSVNIMTLTLAIPDDIAADLGASEQAVGARLKAELAANYYEARLVSLGRAAEMSGLRRGEFEALLAKRRTVRDYGADDLAMDLDWAKGL